MIRRYRNYSGGYLQMVAKYTGADAWATWILPVRYQPGYPEQIIETLAEHLYDAKETGPFSNGPEVGSFYTVPGNDDVSGVITSADPEWSYDNEATLFIGSTHTPTEWFQLEDGGFSSGDPSYRGGTFQTLGGDGNSHTLNYPANGRRVFPGLYDDGGSNGSSLAFIHVLLYGKFACPTLMWPPFPGAKHCEAGAHEQDWQDLAGNIAGRIVWQMAWLEYNLMVDDLCGFHRGGRGGLDKGPRGTFTFTPTPPPSTSGPLLNPTMQAINKALEVAAPEIVAGVIGLLL